MKIEKDKNINAPRQTSGRQIKEETTEERMTYVKNANASGLGSMGRNDTKVQEDSEEDLCGDPTKSDY